MNKYTMSEKIAQNWAVMKTRNELQKELIQLLILLPNNDLKDVYNDLK
tara:strand:+ start:482 stop:625 length:144 start_codon:yes stop_codon:yes gene_type:complete